MAAALVVALIATVFVLSFHFARKQREAAHRQVRDLATSLGLTLEPARPRFGMLPPPRASGTIDGRRARLYTFTTGSGKSRREWCAIGIKPREVGGLTFSFSRQGLDTKLAELFGAREITVGDPAFDQTWFIRTNQPEFFRAALLPELRARLTAALGDSRPPRGSTLKLESDEIVYAEQGTFNDEDRCARFQRLAGVLSDFAAVAEVHARHAQFR